MPFDYAKFDAQCSTMSTDQLLQAHKHYTKLSAGAMTSTAVSALSIPLTLGLSGVAIGLSVPAHHNAKKKKVIVEKYLKARGIEASQATQYANAMASNQAQAQWMEQQQQSWQQQQQGPSDMKKSPPPQDFAHDYNEKREKKSAKGPMSPEPESPAPPPAYAEATSSSSSQNVSMGRADYSGAPQQSYQQQAYSQPSYNQQFQQQWNPQQGMGMNMGYNQNNWGQQQQMMNYGPAAVQGNWNQQQQQPQQGQYCVPSNTYPASAMYSGAGRGDDTRRVRFAV